MGKQAGKKQDISRLRADTGQHHRIVLVMAVLGILAFLPIAGQLYRLMVAEYDYYAAKALRNQTRTTTVTAERGNIYDRNMNILATSVSVENVYLDPHELKQAGEDTEAIAAVLGEILGKEPAWIAQQAKDLKQRYKQIGSRIDEECAARIRNYINENDINSYYSTMEDLDTFFPMTAFDETGIVGHLIMRFIDENKKILRFGFIIVDDKKRGQGYGKEMLQLSIKYAFEILKIQKITLGVFDNNKSAYYCYKAIGFRDVKLEDNEYYHILNEDWKCLELEIRKP